MSTQGPIPFPTPVPRAESAAQAAALASEWRTDLLGAALADEEPDYELLERYTDGTLAEDEAEALALRAEWDPNLARELAELAELRDRLAAGRRAVSTPAVPSRHARVWRTAALAAALLLAVLGLDRSLARRSAQQIDPSVAGISNAPAPTQPLFRDGFESGSASSWAN
jgi:hypothetical protein